MIQKLVSACRMTYYRLRYIRKVRFKGMLCIHKGVKLKVNDGKLAVGKNVELKTGAYFSVLNQGELTIKDSVFIGRNCTIVCHDSVTIGEKCGFGPNVTIYDHDHCFGASGPMTGFRTSPVIIGDNCWIGTGVIILRGTIIGEGSVIGAGTVVRGVIPPYSLVTSARKLEVRKLSEKYS